MTFGERNFLIVATTLWVYELHILLSLATQPTQTAGIK